MSEFIHRSLDLNVYELSQFLAIPSISALPEHAHDIRHAAEWTASAMRQAGLHDARLMETNGNPVVYGEWLGAPGAPTILCYGHYDVQPVDPLDLWTSPPFSPEVRNGKIYARGATDDKGQLFIHLKAIEAHLKTNGRLPVNIKMLIEGEEEVGGANFETFVRAKASLLAANAVVNSDNAMFAAGVPSITCALRGMAYLQVDVRGPSSDLHSGSFGGTVANPALVLAQVLATLADGSGRILIPGFYDDVQPLSGREQAAIAELPFNEHAYRESLGANMLFGEPGFSTLERLWARPTLDVCGLHAGFTGEGQKTVIPALASAKVSMRLVANQIPERACDLFEAHVASVAPPTVTVTVTRMSGGKPWRTSQDDPYIQAACRAMARGFGAEPVFVAEGGSNPIVTTFEEVLGAPVVMFGIGLPTENAHAPNEHLDLSNLQRGIVAATHLYEEFARVPHAQATARPM